MNANDRHKKALQYFDNGYSCAQSVLIALSDLAKINEDTATNIASAFGGGINRGQSICGAISGALMAIGLKEAAAHSYIMHKNSNVQLLRDDFLDRFKIVQENINCRDIINHARKNNESSHKACRQAIINAITIALELSLDCRS